MSTDKAARDASLEASDRLSQWSVDAQMRIDVYNALKAFNATPEARALKGEQVGNAWGVAGARGRSVQQTAGLREGLTTH